MVKYLLTEKRIFKNWRELCEHLGEEYSKETTSKNALARKFRQYFDFEKVKGSQQIHITEVYDKIRPDFTTSGGPLPVVLYPSILSVLKQGEFVTKGKIAKRIHLCSDVIIDLYKDAEQWKKIAMWLNNYDETVCSNEHMLHKERENKRFKCISYYVSKIQSSYNKAFDGAMKKLQEKGFIEYENIDVIAIPKDYTQKIKEIIESKGVAGLQGRVFPWVYDKIVKELDFPENIMWEQVLEYILSDFELTDDFVKRTTEQEQEFIKELRQKACEYVKCQNEREVMSSSTWDMKKRSEYFKYINQELSKYNLKSFRAYHIKKVNSDIELDSNVIKKLNPLFYETMIKKNEVKLEKEFETKWAKSGNSRLTQKVYEDDKKKQSASFKRFADKFIKL